MRQLKDLGLIIAYELHGFRDNNKRLTGAKFILKRYDPTYHEILESWKEQEVSSVQGQEGTLTFDKLQIGSYELVETVSPKGYIRTVSNVRFTVTAG